MIHDLTLKQKVRIWFRKALGGRPMTYIQMLFRDKVTGKMVNLYVDVNGRTWMATNRWGWDREPWKRGN